MQDNRRLFYDNKFKMQIKLLKTRRKFNAL